MHIKQNAYVHYWLSTTQNKASHFVNPDIFVDMESMSM